ncbi:hypothetical protein ACT00U_004989, partial [Escherichia coli]
ITTGPKTNAARQEICTGILLQSEDDCCSWVCFSTSVTCPDYTMSAPVRIPLYSITDWPNRDRFRCHFAAVYMGAQIAEDT